MTTVRTRRIQIGLFELGEDLKVKGGKPLCELRSFQTIFSLNEIPQATVVPLLGENIQSKEGQVSLKKLYELATKSAPVAVCIRFLHRHRSNSSKTDRQYWPKKTVCIFKGYMAPPRFDITAYEAGVSFTIHHWLIALAGISLLTTANSIHNPDDIAIATYGLQRGKAQTWESFFIEDKLDVNKIWESGIKQIFTQVLDWGENHGLPDKLNPFVLRERKRMRTILDKIESSGTKLNEKLIEGLEGISTIVDRTIRNDNYPSFINTCGWTKLIQVYAPEFLFSIVPTADKAYIIPAPCTIDKKKVTTINGAEIFNLNTVPYIAKQVSRVICTADTGTTESITPVGQPHYSAFGVYPPEGVIREGLVHVVAFPRWLCEAGILPTEKEMPSVYENILEPVAKVEKNRDELKKITEEQGTIGQAFATHVYLVQTLNGTTASVALPLRMDICPGAMVKVYVKGTKGYALLYGTVYSVQISMTVGSTPATTVLQLTNIRTEASIDDPVDNPKTGSGYYKEQWSGKGFVLYESSNQSNKDDKEKEDEEAESKENEDDLLKKDEETGVSVANLDDSGVDAEDQAAFDELLDWGKEQFG